VTGTPYAVIATLENNPSKTEVAVSDTESLIKLCRLSNPHLHRIAVGQGDDYHLDISAKDFREIGLKRFICDRCDVHVPFLLMTPLRIRLKEKKTEIHHLLASLAGLTPGRRGLSGSCIACPRRLEAPSTRLLGQTMAWLGTT
jgi:hypothetical protein